MCSHFDVLVEAITLYPTYSSIHFSWNPWYFIHIFSKTVAFFFVSSNMQRTEIIKWSVKKYWLQSIDCHFCIPLSLCVITIVIEMKWTKRKKKQNKTRRERKTASTHNESHHTHLLCNGLNQYQYKTELSICEKNSTIFLFVSLFSLCGCVFFFYFLGRLFFSA